MLGAGGVAVTGAGATTGGVAIRGAGAAVTGAFSDGVAEGEA
jgi:hypothetical protein